MKKTITLLLTLLFLNVSVVYAQDIDIGSEASNRTAYSGAGYTFIDGNNPANASGKITSVEIYAFTNLSGCKVATFYKTDTNEFSTRDYETIGSVTAGSKQTFTVDLDVAAGDYIGIYFSGGRLERTNRSGNSWRTDGEADAIPCTELGFVATELTYSIYGTGTTGITFNGATISKWNTAEISKWNGVE